MSSEKGSDLNAKLKKRNVKFSNTNLVSSDESGDDGDWSTEGEEDDDEDESQAVDEEIDESNVTLADNSKDTEVENVESNDENIDVEDDGKLSSRIKNARKEVELSNANRSVEKNRRSVKDRPQDPAAVPKLGNFFLHDDRSGADAPRQLTQS